MRRLEDSEVAAYDLVPSEVAEAVKIRRAPLLPRGIGAVTVGRTVWLRRDHDRSGSRELIAHELVHVRQYAEQGRTRFLLRYLGNYLRLLSRLRRHRAAYRAIPAEAEARREAAAWAEHHRAAGLAGGDAADPGGA